ncbi:MAG: hypothetical protein ACRDQZ_14405, partial [Mycobacteriales bacterium]
MTFSSGQNYGGNPQGQGMDSAAVGIVGGVILGLLLVGYALSLLFWFAGQLSGLVTGHWPDSSPGDSVKIFVAFFSNLGDPSAAWPKEASGDVGPAVVVYLFFLILMAPVGWGATVGAQFAIRFRRRRENRTFRLGFADGGEVRRLLSGHAVAKKAKSVRPSYNGRRN